MHTCHAAVDDGACWLVWHVFRCVGVVLRLSALCTWQGQPAAHCSFPGHTNTGAAFHPCLHGPGWPTPYIGRGLKVLVHNGGQVVQMVRGRSDEVPGGQGLFGYPHIILGLARFGVPTIITSDQDTSSPLSCGRASPSCWGSTRCRPWPTAPVQWYGGEDTWTAEGRLEGAVSRFEMAKAPTMGVIGPAYLPKGGQRRFGRGASVRGGGAAG
jgi:hypothetical protein